MRWLMRAPSLWNYLRRLSAQPMALSAAIILFLLLGFYLLTGALQRQVSNLLSGPTGRIYVGSPGVYTRERLVNDRNDQDYWLRKQLESLDRFSVVFTNESARTTAFGATLAGDKSEEEQSTPADSLLMSSTIKAETTGVEAEPPRPPTQDADPALDFLQTFTVRSSWRDRLRHQILQNALDDRHDLTGNSVYGLEFATTVVPGHHTDAAAVIEITITSDQNNLVPADLPGDPNFPTIPPLVVNYYSSTAAAVEQDKENANNLSYRLYLQWLTNVQWRLNSHIVHVFEDQCSTVGSGEPTAGSWEENIRNTVNTILAVDQAVIATPSSAPEEYASRGILLPAPWNKYMTLAVEADVEEGCTTRPNFQVRPRTDMLHLFRPGEAPEGYTELYRFDDDEAIFFFPTSPGDREMYRNIEDLVRFIDSSGKILEHCSLDLQEGKEKCSRYTTIPSGYFNFVESVLKADMYAYSIFPRAEAQARLNTVEQGGALGTGPLPTGGSAFVSDDLREQSADLQSSTIGFTSANTDGTNVKFGWIVSPPGPGLPVNASQFALVSVPAWSSQLTIRVESGWLTADGAGMRDSSFYTYTVPIPPDYEAFDAFIIGGEDAVRRPQINDDLMEKVKIVVCQPAHVLVPGLRLWRSSLVTIGSTQAERITVLPNMGGIIAEFPALPVGSEGEARLQVWTSEGVDTLGAKVTITNPKDLKTCEATPPETASQAPLQVRADSQEIIDR